jgi:hypothetical protein
MLYLEAILQSIISTIVFVCVRANNRSELLYRSQTTLQQNLLKSVLLILERAVYKLGLPLSLPPYENLSM